MVVFSSVCLFVFELLLYLSHVDANGLRNTNLGALGNTYADDFTGWLPHAQVDA